MAEKKNKTAAELLLGKNIERMRLSKNMSCMQLGRKINKNKQQIEKYEKGDFVPLSVLEGLAAGMGEPIKKKLIRRISFLRHLEMETKIEQMELLDLYNEALGTVDKGVS